MPMDFKWNKNFARDLEREVKRSMKKIRIPVTVGHQDVDQLDDDCRRVLLHLDEHCKKSSTLIECEVMAEALGMSTAETDLAYDRLEQAGLVELSKTMPSGKSAYINTEGRIAADELRKLPERQRQEAEIQAQERRREHWRFVHEHYIAKIVVGMILFWSGWFAHSSCVPTPDQQPANTQPSTPE